MKKLILSFLIVTSVLLVMGCQQAGLTPGTKDTNTTAPVFEIAINGLNSKNLGNIGGCDAVYLTAFNTTTRARILLGMPMGSTATIEKGIVKMTKDTASHSWKSGLISYPSTGPVTFLAYGEDSLGNQLYSAEVSYNDAEQIPSSFSMTAVEGYALGGFGPAGGYIAYSNTTNHEYLEVAPYGWAGTLGTTPDPQATDGWGMRGIDNTLIHTTAAVGAGATNTANIWAKQLTLEGAPSYYEVETVTLDAQGSDYEAGDILEIDGVEGHGAKCRVTAVFPDTGAVTSISPLMDGTNAWTQESGYGYTAGTKATKNLTDSTNGEDCTVIITVKQIKNTAAQIVPKTLDINGYTGWALPSKGELAAMYTNLGADGKGGFTTEYYWSSTALDFYTAYAQKMTSSSVDALDTTGTLELSNMRNVVAGATPDTYCVRPVRYF